MFNLYHDEHANANDDVSLQGQRLLCLKKLVRESGIVEQQFMTWYLPRVGITKCYGNLFQ